MRWNYTKTLLIIVIAASGIRYVAAVVTGADPWQEHAIGGGPAAGLIYLALLGPPFAVADLIAWWRERRAARYLAASWRG